MEKKLTRGRFVVVAAAGIAGVAAAEARAQPESTVYLLDPCAGAPEAGRCSCGACESHAANKVFFTAAAADAGRAHPYCNCGIVSKRVTRGIQQALSRHARDGLAVDRRHLPPGLARQA